jgi:flagellar hook-associated protein 2
VGLELQRDGTLKIDQAKLDSALADLPALQKAFTNNDNLNAANDGFARRFSALASQLLDIDGSLNTRTQGLQKLIDKNSDAQARLEDRVERFQQRLVSQYTQLDSNVARLNALGDYVNQQFNSNRNTGNR